MTAIEKIKSFISLYPNANILDKFSVDFTDKLPFNGGVFPSGLLEIDRRKDILGNVRVTNSYNFALYYVFLKSPDDDSQSAINADWVMDFQEWVQEQSAYGNAPQFGDEPWNETIKAENGVMYEADEEGTAMYMVQMTVTFQKNYERF